MPDVITDNYDFTLVEVGASDDTWGTKLNANWAKVEALLSSAFDGGTPSAAGTLKTGAYGDDLKITANAPNLTLVEQDQSDPDGRFRLRATGGELFLQKAATAGFATVENVLRVNPVTKKVTVLSSYQLESSNALLTGGSISGLNAPLAVASGGTGGNTQASARQGLGLGGLSASGDNVTAVDKASFHVSRSTAQTNAGVGTWDTVRVDTALFDKGGNFSLPNNQFTAPVDGLYLFGVSANVILTGTAPTSVNVGFGINGSDPANYRRCIYPQAFLKTSESSLNFTCLIDLNAGWTVQANWRCFGNVMDFGGSNTTNFWGTLL